MADALDAQQASVGGKAESFQSGQIAHDVAEK